MALVVLSGSHTDHGLSEAQLAFILTRYSNRIAFFIDSFELPEELGTLASALYGPEVGDPPVADVKCEFRVRGERKGPSKLLNAPMRPTRTCTVIAGPAKGVEGDVVLYTAYGGPKAPREPWDCIPDSSEHKESVEFWSKHALATG